MFGSSLIFLATKTQNAIDKIFDAPAEDVINAVNDTTAYSNALDYLIISDGAYAPMWNIIYKVITALIPIGIAFCTVYFILEIIEMASRDNTTLEHYIKEFIKLIIAVTIVNKSWDIVVLLVRISDTTVKATENIIGLLDTSSSSTFTSGLTLKSLQQDFMSGDNPTRWPSLSIFIGGIIPSIAAKIAGVAVYIAVFMRVMEIAWRTAMVPIGVANLFQGGINSPGIRYIKSILGSMISGIVMYIIVITGFQIMTAVASHVDSMGATAKMLCLGAVELAIIGAAIGASGKTKEAIGG